MTKPLSKVRENDRLEVALSRLKSGTKGLGYWGARDYLVKLLKNLKHAALREEIENIIKLGG